MTGLTIIEPGDATIGSVADPAKAWDSLTTYGT